MTKYVDVVCYDPYPATFDDSPTEFVYDIMSLAKRTIRKPCYALLQAFEWRDYFPTTNELRHMWYQAAIAGANGYGYYAIYDAKYANNKAVPLFDTELWPGIIDFNKNEVPNIISHFNQGEYEKFNSLNEEDYMYYSFEKGDDIYLIILRMDATKTSDRNELPDMEVTIPLKSYDNSKVIGSFTATAIAGGQGEVVTGNGQLIHSLKWRQAVLYKISHK